MIAQLRTRCGCLREIEIDHITREIKVPLHRFKIDPIVVPNVATPSFDTRTFEFSGLTDDVAGKAFYWEKD